MACIIALSFSGFFDYFPSIGIGDWVFKAIYTIFIGVIYWAGLGYSRSNS